MKSFKLMRTLRKDLLAVSMAVVGVFCVSHSVTPTALAQTATPKMDVSDATKIRTIPYELSLESRLSFIAALYQTMPSLFQESTKYQFNVFQILADQAELMKRLNASRDFQAALNNRPPLSEITITPIGNQGFRTTVPIRGEVPNEAIEEFQGKLIAATEAIANDLARSKTPWSIDAVTQLLQSDLDRLDASKPNPGAIIAALQSLLTTQQRRDAIAIKDFNQKLEYLSKTVTPSKVLDPQLFDPSRLKLSPTFSKPPSLKELINYCSEYAKVQAGLSDRLALYAFMMSPSAPYASKETVLERLGTFDIDTLTYLADEADNLRPVFEKFTSNRGVSEWLTKDVTVSLTKVFNRAPTTLVELTPVILVEQPWWYGIIRGFISGDCSSKHSFPYPNDPGERTFFVAEPSAPTEFKGSVSLSSMIKNGKRVLYLSAIGGPRMSPADAYTILYGLHQLRATLGYDGVELPTALNLKGLVNSDELQKTINEIASSGKDGPIAYENPTVRAIIRDLPSIHNNGTYDSPASNSESRRFVPNAQISSGMTAVNKWIPVKAITVALPMKASALQLLVDLLNMKLQEDSRPQQVVLFLDEVRPATDKWGISGDLLLAATKAFSNPANLPFKEFEADVAQRLRALLDSPSPLPRGTDSAESLMGSRLDWLREGYSRTPDLLAPENANAAARVLRDFTGDLRLALKSSLVPAYLFNNLAIFLSDPVLNAMKTYGIVQSASTSTGQLLVATVYRMAVGIERMAGIEDLPRVLTVLKTIYSDHRGNKIRVDANTTIRPLPAGPKKDLVVDVLTRYEIDFLRRTPFKYQLLEDIAQNGRGNGFWEALREAVRMWDTAPSPEGVDRWLILQAAAALQEKFSPAYLELLPVIHRASEGGPGFVSEFLSKLPIFPPSLLDWYVRGFLNDPTSFPIAALKNATLPQAVWDKITTLPPLQASAILASRSDWPQSTINWFLNKFTAPTSINTTTWQPPDWNLLSQLYKDGAVPTTVITKVSEYIARYPSEVLESFEWSAGYLPPELQEAIVREATEKLIPSAIGLVPRHVTTIPQSLYNKMIEIVTSPTKSELDSAAIDFLRETVMRWPEWVKLKLIVASYNESTEGFRPKGKLSRLFSELSGSMSGALLDFNVLLLAALESIPGELTDLGDVDSNTQLERVRVNLSAATFRALLKAQLSAVPDAFAAVSTVGNNTLNSGITLDLVVEPYYLRKEANGSQTISTLNLILSVLQQRTSAIGWSIDPRNPASVADLAVLAEIVEPDLDPQSESYKLLKNLRRVIQVNTKLPTTPAEVIVRTTPALQTSITTLVTQYGGTVYDGPGGRTRVVYNDGSVVEFPSVQPAEFTKVIGDRVAFIEIVGGTATGQAAANLANQVPADVHRGFNEVNPVAGNAFAREGVNQVIDVLVDAGKPPVIGGLPIEGITNGQIAVGKRSSFQNIRNALYEAGLSANVKAYDMLNEVTKWRKGFGVPGMIGSLVLLETSNSVISEQIRAIASGNWDAYDDSYRTAVGKLDETLLHAVAGVAVFEGFGLGFSALSAAGTTLSAGGSTALGTTVTGAGALGAGALAVTGAAFVGIALAYEIDQMGQTATLLDQLDQQAAKVGMADDSWAYSDNPFYRQVQLEIDADVRMLGTVWNAVKEAVINPAIELAMKAIGSPDGKTWIFDSRLENGDFGTETAVLTPIYPDSAYKEWLQSSDRTANSAPLPKQDALIPFPSWLEALAAKGSFHASQMMGVLKIGNYFFPSIVGAPTSRGVDVLKAPVKQPQSTTNTASIPGVLDRMEDAIRRINSKEGVTLPAYDNIPFSDLVAQLGTDPAAWSQALEAGLIDMADITGAFERMQAAQPKDPNAPPPPQIVKGPVSTVVKKGQPITLTVQATGQELYYVWTLDGEPFVKSQGATLSFSPADFIHSGTYVVYVSDGNHMVASAPAEVAVVGFTSQPTKESTGVAGKSLALSAQLSTGAATYQWMKNGAPLAGATSATLNFSALKASDAGTYTLVAKVGPVSVTSDPATVNVLEFVSEPEFFVTTVGARATLSASGKVTLASGAAGAVTYQWLKDGKALPTQKTTVLTIPTSQKSDSGKYSVTLSYGGASAQSRAGDIQIIDRTLSAASTTNNPAFTCTITTTGTSSVSCRETIGTNRWGEVTPGAILGPMSVGLGVRHGCAINALNKVACWGDNSSQQRTPPADLSGAVALGLGPTYSCALLNTGLVRCWGTMAVIPGINQVIALESSASGVCAKTLPGERVCF